MYRINWENILKYGILALCVSSITYYTDLPISSTYVWWSIRAMLCAIMFLLWDKTFCPKLMLLWMTLVFISSVRGCFFCRDYWDWKQLINNVICYSVCVSAFFVHTADVFQNILHFLYKHIWKLFIVLVLFLWSDGIAKFMLPFSFLALFYPLLSPKYKKYVWLAFVITIVFGYDSRSDILKFIFCIILGVLFVRNNLHRYIEKFYWLFFVIPFALFALAAIGNFNVFEYLSNLNEDEVRSQNVVLTDTRTMVYEEVVSSAIDRKSLLWGVTPARGYYSEWMIRNQDMSGIMGDEHYGERGTTESSVLNVFLHFGIFGLIIYLLIFLTASYWAINKSNNSYIPIIGFYVAFRFMFGWIEDSTKFDINMFLLWSMIGMCYSPTYRDMTNEEFDEWLDGILA